MLIEMMKSKIHGARITDAQLEYNGSLTLDEGLMEQAQLFPNEKVQIVNGNNGERIETYLIKGARGSGVCCLNGPAARKGMRGDKIVIISYAQVEIKDAFTWSPVKIFVDADNRPVLSV